ncbi:MAG: DUF2851 family protein, partial [Dehalococcoidia bacterium]|nr:DUF2851 family protein [Dehalococcoidia bacterium]
MGQGMVAVAVRERAAPYRGGGALTASPATSDQSPTTSNDRAPLSEATLATLWAGQRFPESALVTGESVQLRVLHPGRRGRGAGPDFRDALIALPSGAVLRGDVELHVRASDFRA